ncbi:hypothetical protein MMC24_007805 [Lignoscripta atroalba]|nr:hypothetical protein [Lignoscripta atroalba]
MASKDKAEIQAHGDGLTSHQPDVQPVAIMKPKPLFHGPQRSFSSEAISKQWSNQPARSTNKPLPEGPRRIHNEASGPRLARSVSLCSQQSKFAPVEPVPSLPPIFARLDKVENVKNIAEHSPTRSSAASIESGNTFLLDDVYSKGGSQADTDFTALSSHPFYDGKLTGRNVYDGRSRLWSPSQLRYATDPPGPYSTTSVRPEMTSQKSFRASIEQYTLPRSESSGLSMSYLDNYGPSRSGSNASRLERLSRELSMNYDRINSRNSSGLEVGSTGLASAKQPTKSCDQDPEYYVEDCLRKRASTSILQETSGNKGNRMSGEPKKRPFSLATSDPFQWDPETSLPHGKILAQKGTWKGHRRQNCVRISLTAPALMSSTFAPTIEEIERPRENLETSVICGLSLSTTQDNRPLPVLPSAATFNPQIKPLLHSIYPISSEGRPFSSTLSTINHYGTDPNISPVSNCSTPSRKPSRKCSRAGKAPARNSIFDRQSIDTWPLSRSILEHCGEPTSENAESTDSPNLTSAAESLPRSTRPPLFLFPVPAPHALSNVPDWRQPASRRVLGPRAAPARFRTPTRRSPNRLSISRGVQGHSAHSKSQDLKATVMALRRMNSEAVTFDDEARKQYLNMGAENTLMEDKPTADGCQQDEITEGVSKASRSASASTPIGLPVPSMHTSGEATSSNPGRNIPTVRGSSADMPSKEGAHQQSGTPRSLYDSGGFLIDLKRST